MAGDRISWLIRFVLALGLVTSCTPRVYQWADDEVTDGGLLIFDSDSTVVHIAIKNIEEREQGMYCLTVPREWINLARVERADGITSLAILLPDSSVIWCEALSWSDRFWKKRYVRGLVRLDHSDVTERAPNTADGEQYGVVIEREKDRQYAIPIFGADAEAGKWVLLVEFDVGRGTQSPLRKPAAILATPVTVAVDLVIVVVFAVVGAIGWLLGGHSW